jgi:superfamily II DNA/RNA helicase
MEKIQLKDELIKGMRSLGYETYLPVQEEVIPVIQSGKDCLVQAETGAGKTAAYLLPVLNDLSPYTEKPEALVIAPTRELAVQIHKTAETLAAFAKLHCVCVIGGLDIEKQENALKHYPAMVIGTPGRLCDLFRQSLLDLSDLKYLVLDEADQIASTGQAEELRFLLEQIHDVQTVCLSATVDETVQSVFKNAYEKLIFNDKTKVNRAIEEYYLLSENKYRTLCELLEHTDITGAIVFVNYRSSARKISEQLQKKNILSASFSADDEEKKRLRILRDFQEGTIRILCATDAMARGIDITGVSHIIHYDLPMDLSTYVHRSGRTAHQGNTGIVITLIEKTEQKTETAQKILASSQPWQTDRSVHCDLSVPLDKKTAGTENLVQIMIRGGKNEKLRPRDVAGALSAVMDFNDIGTIEIQDRYTLVTILNHGSSILDQLEGLSVKGKKRRIELWKK